LSAAGESPSVVKINLDASVFTESAVKATCYRLAGLADFEVVRETAKAILVSATPFRQEDLESLAVRFRRELIDQDMRERLAQQTDAIRNVIIAHAFSRVPLLAEPSDPDEASS
jgi:His-Xaa-Ser system protein HxsD